MKRFTEYLVESVKEWNIRLKIGGLDEAPDAEMFERIFEKYGLKSLSTFKKTPIQEHPTDFYNLKNSDVYIADASFDYPVTPNEIFYYIQEQTDILANQMVVINSNDLEEVAREEAYANASADEVYKPLLDSAYEEGEDPTKYYGDKYNQSMLSELETRKFELEVPNNTPAKTTNDDAPQTASPMGDAGNHEMGKR